MATGNHLVSAKDFFLISLPEKKASVRMRVKAKEILINSFQDKVNASKNSAEKERQREVCFLWLALQCSRTS